MQQRQKSIHCLIFLIFFTGSTFHPFNQPFQIEDATVAEYFFESVGMILRIFFRCRNNNQNRILQVVEKSSVVS